MSSSLSVVGTAEAANTHFILLEFHGQLKPHFSDPNVCSDDSAHQSDVSPCPQSLVPRPLEDTEISLFPVGRIAIELQPPIPDAEGTHVTNTMSPRPIQRSQLFIGTKILEGRLVQLPKPLLCCRMNRRGPTTSENHFVTPRRTPGSQLNDSPESAIQLSSMAVYGIIREKLVFEERPTIQWTI